MEIKGVFKTTFVHFTTGSFIPVFVWKHFGENQKKYDSCQGEVNGCLQIRMQDFQFSFQ